MARGANIKDVLRVSPRLAANSGKTRIAGEVEFTQAKYASDADDKGKPMETSADTFVSVSNIRLLLSFFLFF